MKSFIFFCILIISFRGQYFAQISLPLLDSNKTWSCFGDFFYQNVKYRLEEDTILNGRPYKKVLAQTSNEPFTFDVNFAEYKSALREDNGVVSVVEKGFISEHILYNFNKQVGDTIRFYRPIGDFTQGVLPNYVVGKIYKTDIVLINGTLRKRWFIHDPYMVDQLPPQALGGLDSQADIWIEGIGSKTGLFSRMPAWGVIGPQPYLLACVDSLGSIIYNNNIGFNASLDDPCFILPTQGSGGGGGAGGGNDSLILFTQNSAIEYIPITVFPNPAFNCLMLNPVNDHNAVIRVYDLTGKEYQTLSQTIVNNTLSLDIQSLNPGRYVLYVESKAIIQWFPFHKMEL
jgi:hypothetical protein